ncbi:MAG: tRNA pseudouridine(38-40) synthase TruA [Clostridia bacterium]|nr:tRNA pseudouridine(38-40) synthase TruA [Clostridia bacterium]
MRNIKAIIEYDGTNYHGFQKQLNLPTIQDTLESCLMRVLKEDVKVQGAGRTDAGTHALGQVINFKTSRDIPVNKIPLALNSLLPKDIVVKATEEMSLDFHAQYDSTGKHYVYKIYNARIPSVFHHKYTYFFPMELNEELLRMGCLEFIGTHNFKGFSASGASVKTFERTIYSLELQRDGALWEIHVKGNGFLYNMVRIIVGTLLEIAQGKREISSIKEILRTQDRTLAGKTVPAHGLYLQEVYYA